MSMLPFLPPSVSCLHLSFLFLLFLTSSASFPASRRFFPSGTGPGPCPTGASVKCLAFLGGQGVRIPFLLAIEEHEASMLLRPGSLHPWLHRPHRWSSSCYAVRNRTSGGSRLWPACSSWWLSSMPLLLVEALLAVDLLGTSPRRRSDRTSTRSCVGSHCSPRSSTRSYSSSPMRGGRLLRHRQPLLPRALRRALLRRPTRLLCYLCRPRVGAST